MSEPLFIEERRQQIIEQLKRDGRVQVKELAEQFRVTEDSIRKDLRFLEKQGLVNKTYGGAVLPAKVTGFVPYRERGMTERKKPIARAAVALIKPGDTIFIESSSYTNLMFDEMAELPGVTVVTNSIYGLPELVRKVNVIHLGGTIHREDESSGGPFALQLLQQMNFDKAFLKPAGITADWKVTTGFQESLAIKKTAVAQAQQVVLLVEEQDWGRPGIYNVCGMDEIDVVVTNGADMQTIGHLSKKNIHVIVERGES